MILVLASAADEVARQFAQQDGHVKLLICRSLSTRGWRLSVPGREPPIAVVDGKRVSAQEIDGVVIRLPHVGEGELPHIAAADRSYVAAEMQAFLFAFLSALKCPVLNRPTPVCLAGPNWRQAQWLKAARESGFATSAVTKPMPRDGTDITRTAVSVVGDRCFGTADTQREQTACRLARATGVQLLRVWFAGQDPTAPVLGADLWPDFSDPQIGAAVMTLLARGVPA
jgi:hypothetical protein